MESETERFIQEYLRGEGNNAALADGLLLERRRYFGPVGWKVSTLERCCGPEPGMKYRTLPGDFEERVAGIMRRCAAGWDMPPLIVQYENGVLTVSDGNHRLEAFARMRKEKIPVIFWMTEGGDYEGFVHSLTRAPPA